MRNGRTVVTGLGALVLGSLTALIVMGALLVPVFERPLSDLGVSLPPITLLVLNSGRWLAGRLYPSQMIPGVVYLLALAGLVVFIVVKVNRRAAGAVDRPRDELKPLRSMAMTLAIISLFALGAVVTALFLLVACMLPLYGIASSSGG